MAAGADSIDDMGLLRHGAMEHAVRRDPRPVHARLVPARLHLGKRQPAEQGPPGVPGGPRRAGAAAARRGTLAFIDVDSTQKRVYGYQKQGAKFGHTKIQGKSLLVKGLNALAAVISTPLSAPVIGAVRLRGGNAASSRGAASLAKEVIGTARECGCTGLIIARLDSGYYSAAVISAIRSAGARFSVTVPMNSSIRAAIAAIPGGAWKGIRYPRAIWDGVDLSLIGRVSLERRLLGQDEISVRLHLLAACGSSRVLRYRRACWSAVW